MPGIKRRKKEPSNKGFSGFILNWFSCAMLTAAKSD